MVADNNLPKGLPGRLAHFRERARLTQHALGEAVGVDKGTVSKWERGEQGMRGEHLVGAAKVLGVTVGELTGSRELDENDHPRPTDPAQQATSGIAQLAAHRKGDELRDLYDLLMSPAIRRIWDTERD